MVRLIKIKDEVKYVEMIREKVKNLLN